MDKYRVMTSTSTIGRRFDAGDLIMLDESNNSFIHIYTNEDSLEPDFITTRLSTITPENLMKVLNNSNLI